MFSRKVQDASAETTTNNLWIASKSKAQFPEGYGCLSPIMKESTSAPCTRGATRGCRGAKGRKERKGRCLMGF